MVAVIEFNRPYNKEKRELKSYVNFGVISEYFAKRCLEEALDKDHRLGLIINKGMN